IRKNMAVYRDKPTQVERGRTVPLKAKKSCNKPVGNGLDRSEREMCNGFAKKKIGAIGGI
ncbi:MAG: hypothetical protein RR415_14650, partial [Ruthenibacterium sp.]